MFQLTRNYFSQLLDYEEDGEFHLISATVAFMKRDLKRIAGFCEVVVPSYAIVEFRSHFRMTNWPPSKFLHTGKQNSQQQPCLRIRRDADNKWRMAWNWFRMANGKHIFRSEIPFGNFGLPFKKSRFPEKISVRGDKIHLSIYIPSEISGFLGKW